jgi:hypothetical protein
MLRYSLFRGVNAEYIGSYLTTFRDNLSVQFSRSKQSRKNCGNTEAHQLYREWWCVQSINMDRHRWTSQRDAMLLPWGNSWSRNLLPFVESEVWLLYSQKSATWLSLKHFKFNCWFPCGLWDSLGPVRNIRVVLGVIWGQNRDWLLKLLTIDGIALKMM